MVGWLADDDGDWRQQPTTALSYSQRHISSGRCQKKHKKKLKKTIRETGQLLQSLELGCRSVRGGPVPSKTVCRLLFNDIKLCFLNIYLIKNGIFFRHELQRRQQQEDFSLFFSKDCVIFDYGSADEAATANAICYCLFCDNYKFIKCIPSVQMK